MRGFEYVFIDQANIKFPEIQMNVLLLKRSITKYEGISVIHVSDEDTSVSERERERKSKCGK